LGGFAEDLALFGRKALKALVGNLVENMIHGIVALLEHIGPRPEFGFMGSSHPRQCKAATLS
jgi:hypothetical protein